MNKYKCVQLAIGVTVGEIYAGEVIYLEGIEYVRIKNNDEGHSASYRPERFEKID